MHTFYSLLALPVLLLSTSSQASFLPDTAQSNAAPCNNSRSMATNILNKAIKAMGGHGAFQSLKGITFKSNNLYRSATMTQTYSLVYSDVFVAAAGTQTISYLFSRQNNDLYNFQQRIDREYMVSEYWIWAQPTLQPPIAFSLVVQDHHNDGYAYFTNGTNTFSYGSPQSPRGYADSGFAAVLIDQGRAMNPTLVWQLLNSNSSSGAVQDILDGHGTMLPAVSNHDLHVTVFFDNSTSLPRFVRRTELNNVFGPSFTDLYMSEWDPVPLADTSRNSSLILPRRYQSIYNSGNYSEDTRFNNIVLNPTFSADHFAPISADAGMVQNSNKNPPGQLPGYNASEIESFNHAALWTGPLTATIANMSATHPIADLSQLWRLSFSDPDGVGGPDYAQLVVELDNGVLVTDAPAHQSEIILQWIEENIKKPVQYIWPTHHHHDHAYGVIDYVRRGAKLVVPEVAEQYWSNMPVDKLVIETYTEQKPFMIANDKVQARGIWHPNAPHAEDWAYMMVTKACPQTNDTIVLHEADAWLVGKETNWPAESAREWLQSLVRDGVALANALVVSTHGGNGLLQDLVDITGFVYPPFGLGDFKIGGPLCRGTHN